MTDTQKQADALFIVGAGPGIGEATAERFGSEGWTIIVSSRSQANVDALVARLSAKGIAAHGIAVDASKAADLRTAIGKADEVSGGLTAVLYNAANVRNQELSTISDAEIDSDIAVNISGGLHTVRGAMDLFKHRPGTILVTGGGFALSPHPAYAGLSAGKAALRNLVQGLAPELAAKNIRIATATVATLVAPDSPEAHGVAETFWELATGNEARWEMMYPVAA
jgi:NAD(P)-dependent dehydrogenase (short-subunit alcohol dehydrogenase family)